MNSKLAALLRLVVQLNYGFYARKVIGNAGSGVVVLEESYAVRVQAAG